MSDWKMRGKPALLILHMQYGIVGSSHAVKAVKESGIIQKQQALLKAFRAKKLPVIYVNVVKSPPCGGDLPTFGFLWQESASTKDTPKDIEVITELSPKPGEPVLINWPFGAFNNSGLEQTLRVYGATTIVPAGFATNGVVYTAIHGGADRYYSVVVPKDASASPQPEAHRAVMEFMAPSIALVTTTEDVIAHL